MNAVETLKHLFLEAGTSWILWLLAGLSFMSVIVTVERWFVYRRGAHRLEPLAQELHRRLAAEQRGEAAAWLQSTGLVAARVAASGIGLADRGVEAADKAMQSRAALEREELERRLAFLGTLGNNAPFIGLFGTVIGVIGAFEELGHGAPGHAGAGAASEVASGAVMSAIAEALVATAVGIAVALPAVAAYNYLQRRVQGLMAEVEVLSNLVLAYLSSHRRSAPHAQEDT